VSPESTDFLYPFIEADERDAGPLLKDLASSALGKAAESDHLRQATLGACQPQLEAIADAMADRFRAGGRLFSFGNGGSSTDAATVAALFARPPGGLPLPARSLVADQAIITALGNDVGFELVFSRQLIAHSRPSDMAVGLSTSGNSVNVMAAFEEAHRRGLLTVGLAGYDGGQMSSSPAIDHCLVVRADSIHRIQETQAALGFELWQRVRRRLEADRKPIP
jgi:D-sedoheptulose 7-phosphate isomerase